MIAAATTPRILWLTEEFYPPQVGGAELMASYLTAGLADAGLDVSVITRFPEIECAKQETIGRVHVRRIPPHGNIKGKGWYAMFAMLGYLFRLASMLIADRRKFDTVIVSGMKIIPLVAVPLCRLFGKRCVIRIESSFEIREPISAASLRGVTGALHRVTAAVLQKLQHWVLQRADRVVVISEEIEELLRRTEGDVATVRIPNAVDLNRFKPLTGQARSELRTRLQIPNDRTALLFSGRLSRAKGIEMLVHAWPQLLQRHPDLYLVIVGGGGESFDNCEQQIKDFVAAKSLQSSVLMAGQSTRVHEYLQAADVFVFPSDYEGFSLGLVEALGSAIPSVVSAVGAAPQLIEEGKNGFLFPPQDPDALNAALERCISAKAQWPIIGQRARAAMTRYDLHTVVDTYLQLCRDLTPMPVQTQLAR
jgi:glycosyltransferase involved in cell wall biosynthesis